MYNDHAMPTPIQHLVLAEDNLTDSALSPAAREWLAAERGAFLLGTIAPDVQTVSGQLREATHFFTFPPTDTRPAHDVMLAQHPTLARASHLAPACAAFIAGYIQHLTLDELWIGRVFSPCFGRRAGWGTAHERVLTHNVLRTWLDQRDGVRLKCDVSGALSQVEPDGWLPFVAEGYLRAWRDEIARQLVPGMPIQTVEVFAARLQIPPAEFRRVLESPEEMQRRVFARLRPGCVDQFYAEALSVSGRRIQDYLGGG